MAWVALVLIAKVAIVSTVINLCLTFFSTPVFTFGLDISRMTVMCSLIDLLCLVADFLDARSKPRWGLALGGIGTTAATAWLFATCDDYRHSTRFGLAVGVVDTLAVVYITEASLACALCFDLVVPEAQSLF